MLRRLYFILPDTTALRHITDELQAAGIDDGHLSVTSYRPEALQDIGVRVKSDVNDAGAVLERVLWSGNLLLFFVATLGAVVLAFKNGFTAWLLVPLAVMAATFIAGLRFTRVPNAHVADFNEALRHGELLLMVDVRRERVAEIEDRVHRRHPEAAVGGVGWASDLLHV